MRATWAPGARTPVLRHRFSWKRLSIAAAVAYWTVRSQAALVFQMRAGAYHDHSPIGFLTDVHRHLRRHEVILIWDGLPSHRSRAMKTWQATQRSWLTVEQLPRSAHDLNPIELVWGNLKNTELANLCPDTIDDAAAFADDGLTRIGRDTDLRFAFLDHCGLLYDQVLNYYASVFEGEDLFAPRRAERPVLPVIAAPSRWYRELGRPAVNGQEERPGR